MSGAPRIAGIDEAGRGPLAGPVVAAAVVFPLEYKNDKIADSKKLSPKIREYLFDEILNSASQWSIVAVGHHRIEALNIREATRVAMKLALSRIEADEVLIDGDMTIETDVPQRTIVGGDALVLQISAASILAKVWRDRLMQILGSRYPEFGFSQHAGYPTKAHKEAIVLYGPCPVHRRTFRGVKEHLETRYHHCAPQILPNCPSYPHREAR